MDLGPRLVGNPYLTPLYCVFGSLRCGCWFRAMFEIDMRERGDGSVTLDNQCLEAFSAFLDFAYSGEILITDGNVDALFQLASFLQVKGKMGPSLQLLWAFFWHLPESYCVVHFHFHFHQVSVLSRACTKFMIGSLDLSNCLSLFSIAEAYGSDSLLQSATDFVIQNFYDLSKMQDFLNMQVFPSLMPSFGTLRT